MHRTIRKTAVHGLFTEQAKENEINSVRLLLTWLPIAVAYIRQM